jgi:hypothetical protein
MVQFETGPTIWSVLTGAKATTQFTGEKDRCNKTAQLFLKTSVLPSLMNAPAVRTLGYVAAGDYQRPVVI